MIRLPSCRGRALGFAQHATPAYPDEKSENSNRSYVMYFRPADSLKRTRVVIRPAGTGRADACVVTEEGDEESRLAAESIRETVEANRWGCWMFANGVHDLDAHSTPEHGCEVSKDGLIAPSLAPITAGPLLLRAEHGRPGEAGR